MAGAATGIVLSRSSTMTPPQRRILGWMFFDWASQPFATLLLTFIFGPYFASAVMDDPITAQRYWGWMLAASGIAIAILAPVLGAMVDRTGTSHAWVLAASLLYVSSTVALWWAVPGSDQILAILIVFALGLVGVEFAAVITNAMLPDLGDRSEIGLISGQGWAFGYLGGLLALVILLHFFAEGESGQTLTGRDPLFGLDANEREGTRFVGPFTAIWYVLFMIPFFLWTPARRTVSTAADGLAGLMRTLASLPRHPSLSAYLLSSMFYRDALNGLFAFGGIYAVGVLQWPITMVGAFGLAGLVFGAVFAWLGGLADRRLGPWPVIMASVLLLTGLSATLVTISRDSVLLIRVDAGSVLPDAAFFLCGCLIGAAGGMIQAASRTMMVHQASEGRMAEAFGLYTLAGKATAFLAPLLIAWTTGIFDSQRIGIIPIIGLFALGAGLMLAVSRIAPGIEDPPLGSTVDGSDADF